MKYFSLILFSLLTFTVWGVNVPSAVKTAFTKSFPQVKNVSWELEDSTLYEAEFKQNGKEFSVVYDKDGIWLETAEEIKFEEAPAALKAYKDSLYTVWHIQELEIIESPMAPKHYELEIEKEQNECILVFDMNGAFINVRRAD